VELHLPVERGRVHEGVLGGEVDAAAILLEHAGQVVLLRAAEVLLQRDLVVVVGLAAVRALRLLADAGVAREVDFAVFVLVSDH
jgi:hypothetical protein